MLLNDFLGMMDAYADAMVRIEINGHDGSDVWEANEIKKAIAAKLEAVLNSSIQNGPVECSICGSSESCGCNKKAHEWELDYSLLSADYKQLGIEIANYRKKEKALRELAAHYPDCAGEEMLAILNTPAAGGKEQS